MEEKIEKARNIHIYDASMQTEKTGQISTDAYRHKDRRREIRSERVREQLNST